MQAIPAVLHGDYTLVVEEQHTAAALGNPGVDVLGTPIVVLMVEATAYRAVKPYLDPGDGVAGTHIDCYHTAPAAVGSSAEAHVTLVEQDRARLSYAFHVHCGERELAHGTYTHMVLPLARLRGRVAG